MKILITGANGLLGQKIVAYCVQNKIDFLATSKGESRNPDCPVKSYLAVDITNKLELNHVFQAFYPTHVIHTAAITNVDLCEKNKELCDEVNFEASKQLFDLSIRYNAHFQLVSTDFVFDGEKGDYVEGDEVNPISYYAKSKVKAENILFKSTYLNWSIVRTIIVYGQGHNMSRSNIVLWVYESLINKKEINVVTDQYRTPTFADDLAFACVVICKKNQKGLFHIGGPEKLSMFDLALKIAAYFKLDKSYINAISSEALNQDAKRPPNTGFNIDKARKTLDYNPHKIHEALEKFEF